MGTTPPTVTLHAVRVVGDDLPPMRLHALTEDGVDSRDLDAATFEPITLSAGDYLIVVPSFVV